MPLSRGGKCQKERSSVFLFLVVLATCMLPGCVANLDYPQPGIIILPPLPDESSPATSDELSSDWSESELTEATTEETTSITIDTTEYAEQESDDASDIAATFDLPVVPSPSDSSGLFNWIPGLSGGEKQNTSNPQYATEQDLLKIVTEFQRVDSTDTYRFPVAKDVTGASVYKATLIRLDDYEAKHAAAYPDIVAFTRARAYEGLHAYDKALAYYQSVGQNRSRLNVKAARAIDALTQFIELKLRPLVADTAAEYLQMLDTAITDWQELQERYADTQYQFLAREEEERLDWATVAFLELNRHRFEDGNENVIYAYRQLIGKHQESKNIYRYQIEFGDFYFGLAREYVAQADPETLRFDVSTFEELGRAALRIYAQVATEDGMIEKLEAKGKLQALEAYMAKIGRLAR